MKRNVQNTPRSVSMLSPESILQLLVSVTAILFGLFGVFLAGYEVARSRVGERWIAYAVLAFFLGTAVVVSSIASLLAY